MAESLGRLLLSPRGSSPGDLPFLGPTPYTVDIGYKGKADECAFERSSRRDWLTCRCCETVASPAARRDSRRYHVGMVGVRIEAVRGDKRGDF